MRGFHGRPRSEGLGIKPGRAETRTPRELQTVLDSSDGRHRSTRIRRPSIGPRLQHARAHMSAGSGGTQEIDQDGAIWVSWRRKCPGQDRPTERIREVAAMGLVGRESLRVDETW